MPLPSPRFRRAVAPALLSIVAFGGCAAARPAAASHSAIATAGAAGAAAPAVVFVVRHAERADTSRDAALSEAGRARAAALAAALRDAGVGAIVTTQYLRTRQTAAPLAGALGIAPEVVAAGGDAAAHARQVAAAVEAQRARGAGAVLVVGHSNTVTAILAALGGPRLPDLCDGDYDDLFVLVLDGRAARLARARYGEPHADAACAAMRPLRTGDA